MNFLIIVFTFLSLNSFTSTYEIDSFSKVFNKASQVSCEEALCELENEINDFILTPVDNHTIKNLVSEYYECYPDIARGYVARSVVYFNYQTGTFVFGKTTTMIRYKNNDFYSYNSEGEEVISK